MIIRRFFRGNRYALIIPVAALLFSTLCFGLAKLLCFWRPHVNMTLPWDAAVPFLPWTVIIYLGSFVYWYLCFVLIAMRERDLADRFFCAHVLTVILSFLCYVLLPTTLERPEITGGGLWNGLMRIVYWVDTPENLFPSLHCSTGWLCWIGLRGRKDLPLRTKLLALILSLLVCASTLTTRQHVMADVVSGVALSEIDYLLASIPRLRTAFSRTADSLLARFPAIK